MFKWFFELFMKSNTEVQKDNSRNAFSHSDYYRLCVKKYYGLQGCEVLYGEAIFVHYEDIETYVNDYNYQIVSINCDRNKSYYKYKVIPHGAVAISEKEYMEATQK